MTNKFMHHRSHSPYDSHNPFIPESVVHVNQDYRFRGFPNGSMESPHVPVTYSPREAWTPRRGSVGKESNRKPLPPAMKEPAQYGRRRFHDDKNNGPWWVHDTSPKPVAKDDSKRLRAPPPLPPANMDLRAFKEEMLDKPIRKSPRDKFSDAEGEIRALKEEKMRRLLAGELEKKQNLHLLQNYHPWGKPGGGAPNIDGEESHRKKKFREEDLRLDHELPPEDGMHFYSPGGGAPLRTETGEVKAELRGDPSIRFRDNPRGLKDLTDPIRYKAPPEQENAYAKDLERIMLEKAYIEQKMREADLKADLDTLKYDPYGRPGAGAPNIRDVNVSQNTTQNNEYNPWGKGFGQPRRDAEGNVERYSFHNQIQGNVLPPKFRGVEELTVENRRRAPLNSLDIGSDHKGQYHFTVDRANHSHQNYQENNFNNHSRQPYLEDDHKQKPNHEEVMESKPLDVSNLFYPFGSPGGGAPNRDAQGNIVTTVYGNTTISRDVEEQVKKAAAAKMYNDELEKEVLQHRLNLMRDRQHIRAPIGELSEIMRQGPTGRPRRDERTGILMDHHLPSSDVTALKNISPRVQHQNNLEEFHRNSNKYGTELEKAAEERRRANNLDRLRDLQEVKQHEIAFNDFWGRPGGGAPRAEGTKMVNFDQALYYPDQLHSMTHYRSGARPY